MGVMHSLRLPYRWTNKGIISTFEVKSCCKHTHQKDLYTGQASSSVFFSACSAEMIEKKTTDISQTAMA